MMPLACLSLGLACVAFIAALVMDEKWPFFIGLTLDAVGSLLWWLS